jgi:hypothetical protein
MDLNDKNIGKKEGHKKILKAHLHPKCLKKRNMMNQHFFKTLYEQDKFTASNEHRNYEVDKLKQLLKKLKMENLERAESRKNSYSQNHDSQKSSRYENNSNPYIDDREKD